MLTGIAVGCFADLKDAADKMVHELRTYYPRPKIHEKYTKIYEQYRKLYGAVRDLM